jgi:hypothetical protein
MKKNLNARRAGALQRLKDSVFFEKKGRTQESWQDRKEREIDTLEKRLNI